MKYSTKRVGICAFVGSVVLSGCGGVSGWNDARYYDAMDVGQNVFEAGHPEQAEQQYCKAFQQALLANEPKALHDAGFNLATMQVRQGHDAKALQSLGRIDETLRTRHWPQTADLALIRAIALYHQGKWDTALQAALQAQKTTASDIYSQAVFLTGLIASRQPDMSELQHTIAQLDAKSHSLTDRVNLEELRGRYALLQQQWAAAQALAEHVITQRQNEKDYPAVRRALFLKQKALEGAGQHDEAQAVKRQIADSQRTESKQNS